MPIFTIPVHESNDCHTPAGSSTGGQFCSPSLRKYPYEPGSQKIPAYLKDDVLKARQAGIAVFHHQQPEPVADVTGAIHDPLAKSHARGGEYTWYDNGWTYRAPSGRIFISTRGGEWVATEDVWGKYGPTGKRYKPLTPDDLKNPATVEDIVSTFRHEVGHLMDKQFGGAGHTPSELAREIRAWQYAVEASPDHTVSERMVRNGLMSHAYLVFRKQALSQQSPYSTMSRFHVDESLERTVQQESKNKFVDPASQQRARGFTLRVMKSLRNYGNVLRKKGLVRVPTAPAPWFPTRKVTPGPGGFGQL